MLELAGEGLVHGPAHSSIGQEGGAVWWTWAGSGSPPPRITCFRCTRTGGSAGATRPRQVTVHRGHHADRRLVYFETREQIFPELTAGAWREWTAALHAGLDDAPPGSPVSESSALVADVFARSFGGRPLLCDLIAHTPLNLERNGRPRPYAATS